MQLYFRKWAEENQVLGGGLEPPKQSPVDPDPSPGQTDAMPRYHSPDSEELPPTNKKKMKKKAKKK
ncbi:MAG: hypothetical protein DWQ19_12440 [Crenarchaeota archaeon]|nr:MAG: hypothetical protein DWQ19_12440 [Thermoproteota archaeon]